MKNKDKKLVPYKCPVCNGSGSVPNGFYSEYYDYYRSSVVTTIEPCRSCYGKGIVWG